MTYEEKLNLLINELVEAKKRTRSGQPAKIFVTKQTELTKKIIPQEVHELLLQLQDDEKVLTVEEIPTELKTGITASMEAVEGKIEYFLIKILDTFDDWLIRYRMRQKSKPENLDWLNLLKVLDVCSDIDQQIQMSRNATVTIPSFPYPYIDRFLELFPYDSVGTRKSYQQHRWEGAQYLLKQGIATEVRSQTDSMLGYGNIVIRINPIKFDDFYKVIKAEFEKRKKSLEKENKSGIHKKVSQTVKREAVWPDDFKWKGKKFVFGKYGSIDFISRDRKHIFKTLTDKKGGWATINELQGSKDAGYARSTIKQIENRLPKEAKKHIEIISTQDDDSLEKPSKGAYRIRFQP